MDKEYIKNYTELLYRAANNEFMVSNQHQTLTSPV